MKKSLVFFLVLFTLYNVFLVLNKKFYDSGQYQFQSNIVNADKYIYSDKTPQNVIIGSSLSERITIDSIPGFYNLAMSGLSIYEGYNILTKRTTLPQRVFIETNVLFREEDASFSSSFNSPVAAFFKQKLPALRDENQPVGVIKHFMKKGKKNNEIKFTEPPNDVFKTLLAYQMQFYKNPDSAQIKRSLNKLKNIVSNLESHNCSVYFFEMPINPKLEYLPVSLIIRKGIKENFPKNKFIPTPDTTYQTTDGVHLNSIEALNYTKYLKKCIKKLG